MGVYVKNIGMPTNCQECFIKESECEYSINLTKRPMDCPLIDVKPHGRLIDESNLTERLGITDMDCFKCEWGDKHGFCKRGGDFNDACEAIEDAPTVIEAESGKTDSFPDIDRFGLILDDDGW